MRTFMASVCAVPNPPTSLYVAFVITLKLLAVNALAEERHLQTLNSSQQVEISEGPAMPIARGSHAGAMLNRHVVVASGSTWSEDRTIKSYLSDTLIFIDGHWKSGPTLPHPTVEASYASDGRRLYIIGGFMAPDKPSADVLALSLDDSWKLHIESLPPFPVAHVGGAAAVLNNKLIVVGGYSNGQTTSDCWMLDLGKPNIGWTSGSPLPAVPRAYSLLVAARDRLYLFGGMTDSSDIMHVFKDAFQFDPVTDMWERVGELPAAGYCWSAVCTDAKCQKLLVAGRADGAIHDDLWLVDLPQLTVHGIGSSIITTTCAPLVQVDKKTFWLIGGEPNSNKTRTAKVTCIHLP